MRTIPVFMLLALLATPSVQAAEKFDPKTPRGLIMAYECGQIDPRVTGFSCRFNEAGLSLRWHETTDSMPTDKQSRARYEFEKIALRYLDLGGRHFNVFRDQWPKDRKRICSKLKNFSYNTYTCVDCTMKADKDGGASCVVD
jgi:hypothetical protein